MIVPFAIQGETIQRASMDEKENLSIPQKGRTRGCWS